MNRYKLSKAGINVNEGIERFNNNKGMYETLLYGFLDDTHFNELCKAVDAGDAQAAFQAAHALKGIVGNLSINKFFEVLNPFVEDLRVGSLDNAEKSMAALKTEYDIVVTALSE